MDDMYKEAVDNINDEWMNHAIDDTVSKGRQIIAALRNKKTDGRELFISTIT
jgi:hypothetical protein